MLPFMSRASSHPCSCGCGAIPSRGRYLRGHWLKQHRTDRQFISLDDLPESDGVQPRASFLDWPAGQLLVAVFDDALAHRQECLSHHQSSCCLQCARDVGWARMTAEWGVYSFVSVCEYLGFDPDAVRVRFLARGVNT
jgi:hypothetical protein